MKKSIRSKILALVLVPVFVITAIFLIEIFYNTSKLSSSIIKAYKEKSYHAKELELKSNIKLALNTLSSFYEQTKHENLTKKVKGKLTAQANILLNILNGVYDEYKDRESKKELQNRLKAIVKGARYGKSGYFWINDLKPKMVMHPIKPSLNGKDLSDFKDPNGKKLFVEMAKTVKNSKQGFVDYQWAKPGFVEPQDKISYVFSFKPFNWVIGTGEYVDNITGDIQREAIKTISKMRFGKNNTGYFWIQDKDIKMVSHPTKPALNGKDLKNIKDPNGVEIFKEANNIAFSQGEGLMQYIWQKPNTGKLEPKISYVILFKEWKWVIGTGIYTDDIEAEVNQMLNNVQNEIGDMIYVILGSSSISILLLLIAMSFLIKRFIVDPIVGLRDTAKNLSIGDGDLTKKLEVKTKDEIGETSSYVNNFIEKIKTLVIETKLSAQESATISSQLSSTSAKIKQRVETNLNTISQSVEDNKGIKVILDKSIFEAEKTKDDILLANEKLSFTKNEVNKMIDKINISAQSEIELASKLTELSENAKEVSNVLTVIRDIADQTNLLALNAAIEAARAGEHGRGFAVVADSVRSLAERTQKSLDEINTTINLIVQAIVDASGSINENALEMEDLANISNQVGENMNQITVSINSAAEMADKSVVDSIKIAKNTENIINQMEDINNASISNVNSIKEIKDTTSYLYKNVKSLTDKLNQFKT